MTDQGNNSTENVALPPAQEASATTPPSTITKEDLDAFKREIKQDLAQLYQGVQSKTDKFSAKMQQKMEAIENAAKAAGIQLSDAERQQLQSQAKLQLLNQQASTVESFVYKPGQARPFGLSEEEFANGVNAAADALFKNNKIEIKRGDPEDSILAEAEELDDPDKYLEAVQKAIDTKKARIGDTSQTVQPPPSTATDISPGLVRGKPQANQIANITDPNELWKLTKFPKGKG